MAKYKSVGIIIYAKDTNNFLMLHRKNHPITWSVLAGGMEKGENPIQTIKREITEEIGIDTDLVKNIQIVGTSNIMGHTHYVIVGFVDKQFKITNLDVKENDEYGWFNEKNLPLPLHPGFMKSLYMVKPLLNLSENLKKSLNKLLNE